VQIIMIAVESREQGLDALDRLDDAVAEGRVTVEDAAMVYKNDKGKVKIHQTHDATGGKGAVRGGALGLLVGVFAAPLVAATAVGAGAGALVAKFRDSGVSDKMMKQAGELIEGSEAGIFILADDSSVAAIAEHLDAVGLDGKKADYTILPPEAQGLLTEALKVANA
jgi:uncharacterized membrane protein